MNTTTTLTGWQDSPIRRGTWEIIGNCAVTIFTCTWTIQHMNIPGPNDTFFTTFRRTLRWMGITVLFPEFLSVRAYVEILMAMEALGDMDKAGLPVKYPLFYPRALHNSRRDRDPDSEQRRRSPTARPGTAHIPPNPQGQQPDIASVADPGPVPQPNPGAKQSSSHSTRRHAWTLTHSYFANMGGFIIEQDDDSGEYRRGYRQITGHQIARQHNNLSFPCQYSEEIIKDKNKSDAFAKGLAIVQISNLFLSSAVRKRQNLPISQLEIVAVGFSSIGILTFILYWYKPRNVTLPLSIDLKAPNRPNYRRNNANFATFHTFLFSRRRNHEHDRIPNDILPDSPFHTKYTMVFFALLSAAYSAFPTESWNSVFPTPAEQTAWRAATIVSIVVPLLGLIALLLLQDHRAAGDSRSFIEHTLRFLNDIGATYEPCREKQIITQAHDKLQGIYSLSPSANEVNVRYKDIFAQMISSENRDICRRIRCSLTSEGNFETDLRTRLELIGECYDLIFRDHFLYLLESMDRSRTFILLERSPATANYPKKESRTASSTRVIQALGIVYCLARLAILALALSSLRLMADRVYTTTWTKYIPIIQ